MLNQSRAFVSNRAGFFDKNRVLKWLMLIRSKLSRDFCAVVNWKVNGSMNISYLCLRPDEWISSFCDFYAQHDKSRSMNETEYSIGWIGKRRFYCFAFKNKLLSNHNSEYFQIHRMILAHSDKSGSLHWRVITSKTLLSGQFLWYLYPRMHS